MPRYEFKEGTSNKFWEIALEGTSFTTTYGRIGTSGQTSLKEYDTEPKAKAEYEKLIAEKTKKGYVLVSGDGAIAAPAPAPAAPAPKPAPKPAEKQAPAKAGQSSSVFGNEGEDEEEGEDEDEDEDEDTAATSKASQAGARYFELVDGSSKKFWEVRLEGSSFITRYGRLGTSGQETLKEFDSEETAIRECEKLVAEKTKKGYVEKSTPSGSDAAN